MTGANFSGANFRVVEVEFDPVGHRTLMMTAQSTNNPDLVIAPELITNDVGVPSYSGGRLTLVHARTGRIIAAAETAAQLLDLAQRLSQFDLGDMTVDENASVELSLGWDDDSNEDADEHEAEASRNAEPALRFLREQLDWWNRCYQRLGAAPPLRDASDLEVKLWYQQQATQMTGYGVIYLLTVLQHVNPTIAGLAATDLSRTYSDGDAIGQRINRWRTDLVAGRPLTAFGIPDAGDLGSWFKTA